MLQVSMNVQNKFTDTGALTWVIAAQEGGKGPVKRLSLKLMARICNQPHSNSVQASL